MAVIGQLTFPSGVDQYLALGNEEYVRPLAIGNNWTSIRISLHLAVNNNSGVTDAAASLMLGVCSGTLRPFSSPRCQNYVGIRMGVVGSGWSYVANAGNPYYVHVSSPRWTTRINGALSDVLSGNGVDLFLPCAGVGLALRRTICGVVITKGAPSYTTGLITNYNYFVNSDWTTADFLNFVDQPTLTPVIPAGYTWTNNGGNIAMSEAAGPLDTFSLYWNRSIYPLHIYAIGVTRIS